MVKAAPALSWPRPPVFTFLRPSPGGKLARIIVYKITIQLSNSGMRLIRLGPLLSVWVISEETPHMRKPQSGASCQISSLFSTLSRSIIRSINVIIGVFMHRNRLTVICITPCSRLLLCIDMRPGRECLSHKYLQEIIKTKYGSSPSEQLSFLHPDSACFLVFSSHQSRECS